MQTTRTVLLAEDNASDVVLICRAFKSTGVAEPLVVVQDGDDAIAYLRGLGLYANRIQFPLPSLLLLDLDMPRKSGLQVLAWIRQQPEFQELPVIVLTTSVFSSDVRAAYALGANSFLVKPVDFTDLVSMVRHACDFWLAPARQNARPVVSPADTPPPAPLASSSNVLDQPPAQPGKRGI